MDFNELIRLTIRRVLDEEQRREPPKPSLNAKELKHLYTEAESIMETAAGGQVMNLIVRIAQPDEYLTGGYAAFAKSEWRKPHAIVRLGWTGREIWDRIGEHNEGDRDQIRPFVALNRLSKREEQILHRQRLIRWRVPGTSESYYSCDAFWEELKIFCREREIEMVMIDNPPESIQRGLWDDPRT